MLTKTEVYQVEVTIDSVPEKLAQEISKVPDGSRFDKAVIGGGVVQFTFIRQVAV